MSRKQRVLHKRFAVFCESDTEYNYVDKIRKNQGVESVLKTINMHLETENTDRCDGRMNVLKNK